MGRRVVVTGASGFVGAVLARRLIADGHAVHLLLRPGHAAWRIDGIRDAARRHLVDLTDPAAVDRAIAAIRPEWIFHLAAHGAYSSQTDVRTMIDANLTGLVNLIEAGRRTGFEAFVSAGSSSEYGFQDRPPPETERLEPNSAYAVTKAAATHYGRLIARTDGLRIVTLRLYSVYGPYEEPTRLIPTLLLAALDSQLPPLADPRIARDFVHVDDVCDAFLSAATGPIEEPGAIFNVGTGVQTDLATLVAIVREALDLAAEPVWGGFPDRTWDTTVWVADNRKIRSVLGWEPRIDLAAGVRQTIDWFRANPAIAAWYRTRIAARP